MKHSIGVSSLKRSELINLTGDAQDEHQIVFRDGKLQFWLPASCHEDVLLHVISDLEEEAEAEVKKLTEDSK